MDFSLFRVRVGENIRRARHASGLSLEDVATKVLTYRRLSALENGRGNPELQTLFALARLFKVTAADLIDVMPKGANYMELRDRPSLAPKPGRKAKVRRYSIRAGGDD